ncbi:MAG: complex I NDUFA9 subunit family protein [Desulfuromonadales bacterium]|jgi:NADH dehydrogenase
MRVFLTGGAGFVGGEILRQLIEAGHLVRMLVRPGSESGLAIREGIEIRRGDVTDPATLDGALRGCEAVIHLVGIIRENPARGVTFERLHVEGTGHMLAAAAAQGVRRFLHMSANGTRENAESPYHRTKWRAEEEVRASHLDWTIFRPSLIFGEGSEFVGMLADLVRRLPVVPVIGDGRYRMTPVAVEDVAAGFVAALQTPAAVGQTYHCCGPADYAYDEVLDLVGAAVGRRRVPKLHQPVFLVRPVIALFDQLPRFPITRTQLTMLLAGNVCDPRPWAEALGLSLHPFPEALSKILKKG